MWVDDKRDLEKWKKKPGFEYLLEGRWIHAHSYAGAIIKISAALCDGQQLEAISLDNDLGDKLGREGYDLLSLIEQIIVMYEMPLPEIHIHTDNAPARDKMRLVVACLREKYGTH